MIIVIIIIIIIIIVIVVFIIISASNAKIGTEDSSLLGVALHINC